MLASLSWRTDPDGVFESYSEYSKKFKFYAHNGLIRLPQYYRGLWSLFTPSDCFFALPPGRQKCIDLKLSLSVPLGALAYVTGVDLYRPELVCSDLLIGREDLSTICITIKNVSTNIITIRPHSPIACLKLYKADTSSSLYQVDHEYLLY